MASVVGQRGDGTFLVETDPVLERGHVVDIDEGIVHPVNHVQSILARGYWDDVTDEVGAQRALELVARNG